MSDVAGILSTIILGVLALWAVAGWVRSQTNRGRERLEVANTELNSRNADLARQVAYLSRRVAYLEGQPGQTQEVPSMFADGYPTWFGRDAHLDGES